MVYRFYCMALFHSQTRRHMIKQFNKIDTLQNIAIRYFLGVHRFTPILATNGEMSWTSSIYRRYYTQDEQRHIDIDIDILFCVEYCTTYRPLAGYGLPPPPRGNFVDHIFLKAQCLARILQHVSPLTMAALSCNSLLHTLP